MTYQINVDGLLAIVRSRRLSEMSLEWTCNIVLGVLFFFYAYEYGKALLVAPRLSVIVMLVFTTMAGTFFMIRRAPKSHSRVPVEWFCAAGGTWVTLLFRPLIGAADVPTLQVLLICGMLVSMTGLISLGRSFGIVPANRGVQRSGLYRFVRHPMYFGYVVMHSCFVGQHFTYYNVGILFLFVLFTVLRIIMEERHLSKDDAYREMQQAVRYRLVPFVW
jgi:protein-S-isoprenylcysteine O-methyltransferase Ste14